MDEQGKCIDQAAGVAILLSKRMRRHIDKSVHVGSRIAWVRLRGPVCPIFFVTIYVPHKYRTETPITQDTLTQLDSLLKTVTKNDCVVVCGDFNCRLKRNIPGCTDRWCVTKHHEKFDHDQDVLDLMRAQDLFAVDTKFNPKAKVWKSTQRKRQCNTTYLSNHTNRRPTKLDYFLVSIRWQGMVANSERQQMGSGDTQVWQQI